MIKDCVQAPSRWTCRRRKKKRTSGTRKPVAPVAPLAGARAIRSACRQLDKIACAIERGPATKATARAAAKRISDGLIEAVADILDAERLLTSGPCEGGFRTEIVEAPRGAGAAATEKSPFRKGRPARRPSRKELRR